MATSIRRVRSDEFDRVAAVWQVVYRADQPFEPSEIEGWRPERSVLAEVDGRVAGVYTVEPLRLTRGKGTFQCGGIGAVAVLPEFRRTGVASQLMRWSLQDMRESGSQLAALYAYRDGYYRRFGYEVAGRRWQIKCPQHRFPRYEQELPCRKLAAGDAGALDSAYVPFVRSISGGHLRCPEDWSHRLGKRPPMIYGVGDPVEGYFWTRMEGGFWEPLVVGELVWSTRRGYESVMAVLGGLAANRSEVVWDEPSCSPFFASNMDQGVSVSSTRHAQFRILDVPSALKCLAPEGKGRFSLEVLDPEIPANRGPWAVEFEEGRVSVERCEEADLTFDERSFVQAYLGEPSLEQLASIGRVSCKHRSALRTARELMPPLATMLTEFF